MPDFSFTTCPSLINEAGATARLGELCLSRSIKRPLIVTDQGIVRCGLLAKLEAALSQSAVIFSTYAEVIADPPEAIILAALEQGRSHGVDAVIGFGGGSSMDTAKLVALMLGSQEALGDIYGVDKARGPRLPLLLIPTTAGTGSEATAVAIVTTGETTKMGVVSPYLFPDVAILDAELTLNLPPAITAMTGVDAMVHALEAYTSTHKKNPYSDMLAREALGLMAKYLPIATHHGEQLHARQATLYAACLAGQAFANAPVAAVHALAYPLGGHYHIPHGLSNSLVLPSVLRFNSDSPARSLYAELAPILLPGKALPQDEEGLCEEVIHYFEKLIGELDLPNTLSQMNIPEADLPMLAADAMAQQRLLVNNPRPVTEADALAIYRAAFA